MAWLKNKIAHFVSLGDGDGRNFWMAIQNGDTVDLGISGGMRSQLNPYVIINPAQMAAYESVINLELLPRDKKPTSQQITAIANRSPVSRALYHGALNDWIPMPRMENYSGFDRDSRTFINKPATAATTTIAPPATSAQTTKLLTKLELTQRTSLDEFITYELAIFGEKQKRMKQAIIDDIICYERQDLKQKFSEDF